jgi:hypothetical protein
VCEVQRQWRREIVTEPATRLTIARNRDRFETDGTVHEEILLALFNSTCFGHPFYVSFIISMEMSHFAFNKMAHHHATTGMSEPTSMEPYQVNG